MTGQNKIAHHAGQHGHADTGQSDFIAKQFNRGENELGSNQRASRCIVGGQGITGSAVSHGAIATDARRHVDRQDHALADGHLAAGIIAGTLADFAVRLGFRAVIQHVHLRTLAVVGILHRLVIEPAERASVSDFGWEFGHLFLIFGRARASAQFIGLAREFHANLGIIRVSRRKQRLSLERPDAFANHNHAAGFASPVGSEFLHEFIGAGANFFITRFNLGGAGFEFVHHDFAFGRANLGLVNHRCGSFSHKIIIVRC